MSTIIDEHYHYLADQARLAAFRQAIEEVVRPGDVVLDLGAGTGILGLLACRAGASRVYSIEEGKVIELARKLCQTNGFQDRVTFIKGFSTWVNLPEKVDVVLADQIGFGSEFGLMEYYSDARERFLKPEGFMIPSRVDMCLAPVECRKILEQIDVWDSLPAGFDVSSGRTLAVNTYYRVRFSPDHLLGAPVTGAVLDLAVAPPASINMEASFEADQAGVLHGIGGWFSARLSSTVAISNSPIAAHPINRSQVFFPIDQPVNIAPGDRIHVRMHVLPIEHVVTWDVEVCGQDDNQEALTPSIRKGAFAHSTWKGMLIAKEDLRRTRPGFVPTPTSRGEALLTVLSLCDGRRSLSDIEAEVGLRHPTIFRSKADIAAFVADVVTRYTS